MWDELDRRITASAFLRPVVAEAIRDESTTSLECVRVCNMIICIIEENISRESEVVSRIKSAIHAIQKELNK